VSTAVILQGINVYHGVFANWISPDGRCLVWFPAKPVVHEVPGKVTFYTEAMTSVFGDGYGYYSLSYEDLPGGSDSQFDWASFEQMITDDDSTIESQDAINVDGWPGRRYLVTVSPRGLNAFLQWYEAFPVGGKLYTLCTFGDNDQHGGFVGSFRLRQQPAGGNSGGTASGPSGGSDGSGIPGGDIFYDPNNTRAHGSGIPGGEIFYDPQYGRASGRFEYADTPTRAYMTPMTNLDGTPRPPPPPVQRPAGVSSAPPTPGGDIFYDPQYGRASGRYEYAPTRAYMPPMAPATTLDGTPRQAGLASVPRPPPPPLPPTPPAAAAPTPPTPVASNTVGNRGNRVPMPPVQGPVPPPTPAAAPAVRR
jgi:hypothetical protein